MAAGPVERFVNGRVDGMGWSSLGCNLHLDWVDVPELDCACGRGGLGRQTHNRLRVNESAVAFINSEKPNWPVGEVSQMSTHAWEVHLLCLVCSVAPF